MNVDYSAFEGWPIEGRPSLVTVRGKVQVRDRTFVGELGHGKLLTGEQPDPARGARAQREFLHAAVGMPSV